MEKLIAKYEKERERQRELYMKNKDKTDHHSMKLLIAIGAKKQILDRVIMDIEEFMLNNT